MRRENRKRENEGTKTLMYAAGSIILLVIISFIIGFMFFSNKIKEDASESQFSTSKISDLVPNTITNQENTEETSSSMGKTVNQVQNTIENTMTNTIDKNVVEENKTVTSKTESSKNEDSTTEVETNATEKKSNETPEQENETAKIEEEEKSDPVFVKPVEGETIREFAKDKLVYSETLQEWITHNGIDIKADKTTVVKSAATGKVSSIKNDPRYGLTVTIEHDNGFKSVYANLLTAEFITEGEAVESGQTIGTVGNTATFEILDEPHLHFEILKDGEYVDPTIYIK